MSENTTDEDPGRWEGGASPRLAEGGPGGGAAGCARAARLPFPPAAVPGQAGSFQVPAFFLVIYFGPKMSFSCGSLPTKT